MDTRIMKSLAGMAVAGVVALSAATASGMPVLSVTGSAPGTFSAPGSTHGWEFVANSNIVVTALGLYDEGIDGFATSHPIGLFRLSDSMLLTSGSLSAGTSDALIDNFRYVDTADVSLTSGVSYVIAYYTPAQGDQIITSALSVITDPVITLTTARFQGPTGGLVLPGDTTTNDRFGPNFLYSAQATVPEPGTLALFGLGLAGLGFARRRKPAQATSDPSSNEAALRGHFSLVIP